MGAVRRVAALLCAAAAARGGYVEVAAPTDTCASKGLSAILTKAECERAAKELGLNNTRASETHEFYKKHRPAGCYEGGPGLLYKGLWFNRDLASTGDGHKHGDRAICSTDPASPTPAPEPGPRQARCDSVCSIVKGQGYNCECHDIVTPDGFVLQTVRIPASKAGAKVAWLQHGFEDCCVTWVAQPEASDNLAFMLHDAGYDVWIGNNRGNVFSLQNSKLDISEKPFWQAIDFDNMASIDVPTCLDYVLKATGQAQIYYAGHSQGTLQLLAALSRHQLMPDGTTVGSKLAVAALLAPVGYIHHTRSLLLKLLADIDGDQLVRILGFKQFLGPNTDWLLHQLTLACDVVPKACPTSIWPIMGGGNFSNVKVQTFRTATEFTPADSSVWNLVHWAQHVRREILDKHNWGKKDNAARYNGSEAPPLYDLTQITGAKLALFHGELDDLADKDDVATLIAQVPKSTVVFQKDLDNYGHMDFVWGLDAHIRVYADVLKVFAEN
eukprot:TRINITY_DN13554_c0_g1_i2.p2 TRINITY_DN13554_c0_g1~~TRINITY_DN13554_c0_g1_i2.p2  ORF type:complete len:498 (+),score=166.06 TRINITY_DN13554_c0_g1_i2:69-1562(+)